MKIIDDITTILSNQVRSFWYIIQDLICLVSCIIASYSLFPFYEKAYNLFIFFTIITLISFLYKVFKTDLYERSVEKLGVWGSFYRCFYAIYYPIIAFTCASWGGFWGYFFAMIWLLSGGTYLVVADKIAREENKKIKTKAEEIIKDIKDISSGCPYCKTYNYTESLPKKSTKSLKIVNVCNECHKEWTEVFNFVDMELRRQDLIKTPDSEMYLNMAEEILG